MTDATTVTNEFGKLLDALELRKPGRNFYTLRHVFRTVADATKDFPVIRLIMGHVDDSIDTYYREQINDGTMHNSPAMRSGFSRNTGATAKGPFR